MYIVKNALRSISRSKGRNILIGIIVFVISFSVCVSLSIREASDTAAEEAMDGLKVTAQITMDREGMMQRGDSQEDRKELLQGTDALSLEELQQYAEAESVDSFYYTLSASLNGASLEPVDLTGVSGETTESTQESEGKAAQTEENAMPGGKGGGFMGTQGDFTLTGYSSDEAMSTFLEGSSSITDGAVFAEGTADGTCIINSELASYNDLSVGDEITLSNPNNEEETYILTICGIYETEASGDSASSMMGGFAVGADSSNQIYLSYQTLAEILAQSENAAETTTDSTTGMTTTTAIASTLNGTYTFASVEDYKTFEEEVRDMGLSEDYTVSSADLNSYEQSMEPLKNLSRYAGYFLLIVLIIGAIILIVLHIFAIRERKYEIGVLAAIGMKKWKIAVQFLTESLCVTFAALIIGAGIGAVSSVPITNQLLAQQIESSASSGQEERFGREVGGPGTQEMGERPESDTSTEKPDNDVSTERPGGFSPASYIDSISSATNIQVVGQMVGIGLLLALLSGGTALIFIMRYDPLRILSSRD